MFPCIWLRTVLSSVFLSIWGRDSLAAKIERASEWNSGREWQIVELFHIANLIDCFVYSMSDSKWCETQKCHLQKKREKNKHMKYNLQTRKEKKDKRAQQKEKEFEESSIYISQRFRRTNNQNIYCGLQSHEFVKNK